MVFKAGWSDLWEASLWRWSEDSSERLWESFSPLVLKPAGVECEEHQVHGIAETQGPCLEWTLGQKWQCQKYTKKISSLKFYFFWLPGDEFIILFLLLYHMSLNNCTEERSSEEHISNPAVGVCYAINTWRRTTFLESCPGRFKSKAERRMIFHIIKY